MTSIAKDLRTHTMKELIEIERRCPPIEIFAGAEPVVLARACFECSGTGEVTDSRFTAWMAEREAVLAPYAWNDFQARDYFGEKFDKTHPMPEGSDVGACSECAGTGMTLTENGAAILRLTTMFGGAK